jgi:GNAT superfamily N-acetyltransferase
VVPEITIIRLSELGQNPSLFETIRDIEKIFFENSVRKAFSSEKQRLDFYHHWMDYYLNHERNNFYLALTETGVIGYLTGCLDSIQAAPHFKKHTGFTLFSDLHYQYLAHLHINLLPSFQGFGIGSKLIRSFVAEANALKRGVHIVTDPQARNASFYERLGFSDRRERKTESAHYLFMGYPAPIT